MRTVKQISELTGISVRALHYYDEIGLFKPSKVTEAGYRMYDDALQVLQQILFFRELVEELVAVGETYSNTDLGENYWGFIADGYLSNSIVIETTDRKYGNGASAFIGAALKAYQDGENI